MKKQNITKKVIERRIKELIAEVADIDMKKISSNTEIFEGLGIDSFMAVELFYNANEKFGISISNDQLASVKTIKDIVNLVYINIHKK